MDNNPMKMLFDFDHIVAENTNLITSIERFLDYIPGNIYWKNRDHFYLGCNQSTADTLQLSSWRNIIGKRLETFADVPLTKEVIAVDEEIMQQGVGSVLEETGWDGRIFLSRKTPLYDKNKNVCGLIGISLDITKQRNNIIVGRPITKQNERLKVLSKRERECLQQLAQGYRAKEIAQKLSLSPRTVEDYLQKAKDKLGCYKRSEMIQIMLAQQKV